MAQRPRGRPRGALEHEVIAALAAGGRPMTAADVLAELDSGLAYTTVMTTLGRLYEKGALTRELSGRAYRYELASDVEDVDSSRTAREMRRLLEAREDRAKVLTRFVAGLDPDDERFLAELLNGSPDGPVNSPNSESPE